MKKIFLNTKRLGFSMWNENDIDYALELWGNPEVTKFIVADGRMLKDQVYQRLNKEIETNNKVNIQYWPINLIETNKNIGCCGIRPYNSEKNIFEIGIHLKENYWGMEFAKEACSKVIEYAYTHDEFYSPTKLYHPSYLMVKEDYNNKRVSRMN